MAVCWQGVLLCAGSSAVTCGQRLLTQALCSLLLKHLLAACPDLSLHQGHELVNEWSLKTTKHTRVIGRQVRHIQREEEKVKQSIKEAAEKGQKRVCDLGEEPDLLSKGHKETLCIQISHVSVLLGIKNQLGVLRVAGSLQSSSEVMKAMQKLVKTPVN